MKEMTEVQQKLYEISQLIHPNKMEPKERLKSLSDVLYLAVTALDFMGLDDDDLARLIESCRTRRERIINHVS